MVGLNLGAEFNAALAALAGWDPDTIDPASVDVPFVNLSGDTTTVRATVTATIPTAALTQLIAEHVHPDTA
ncbi:hypothetical protein HP467_07315 [Curtobacterium albidum]|uniref:Uncharacterized protein n=1 Tax=Curtobacterium citreum TaxID=2036 RepID=A0A850DUU1_9MICO|nr:hypothetical protein [Curtobacterium albidum]NUU27920.1 hypothetical protein [Curtobacterium albidum]